MGGEGIDFTNEINFLNLFCPQGCSTFAFGGNSEGAALLQQSVNPAVYAKLSCFLPWVAAQYDMDYTPPGDPDLACLRHPTKERGLSCRPLK